MNTFKNKKSIQTIVISFFILFFYTFSLALDDLNASDEEIIVSKVLYLEYDNVPKIVYTKQRFSIDLKANILLSKANINYKISTNINEKYSNIILINDDITWKEIDENNYVTTLQFKVAKHSIVLPIITISLFDEDNNLVESSTVEHVKIAYRKIAINQDKYSNVIANSLSVNSIKTKQYSNKQLIHSIAISAKNGNLEDFNLKKYKKQGIKVLNSNNGEQVLYYYIISQRDEKMISFNYFNTKLNKFENVSIDIAIEEELVSTQTDLNPYENDMRIYKIILIAVIVMFFLMIYFFKREFFYLFFSIIFMTFLILMLWPNNKMTLNKDTKVYILPTANSTIFHITNKLENVEILIKNEKFSKILFKNKNIGWIKNDT